MFDNDPQRLIRSDRRLEPPEPFGWDGFRDGRARQRGAVPLPWGFREPEGDGRRREQAETTADMAGPQQRSLRTGDGESGATQKHTAAEKGRPLDRSGLHP